MFLQTCCMLLFHSLPQIPLHQLLMLLTHIPRLISRTAVKLYQPLFRGHQIMRHHHAFQPFRPHPPKHRLLRVSRPLLDFVCGQHIGKVVPFVFQPFTEILRQYDGEAFFFLLRCLCCGKRTFRDDVFFRMFFTVSQVSNQVFPLNFVLTGFFLTDLTWDMAVVQKPACFAFA